MTSERRPTSSFLDKRTLFDEMLCETGDVLTISSPSTQSRFPEALGIKPGAELKLRWVTVGPNPVKNLETDALGIYATLSFGGQPYSVFLAWDDVNTVACELCAVGFPPVAERPAPPASTPAPVAKKVRGSHLRLVK